MKVKILSDYMDRLDSDYLTQLFFNSPAMQSEIINENVKAPHNCD